MCCVWGKRISWDFRARGSRETPASKSHATWFPRGRAVSHRAHRGLFSSLLLKQQQWVKLNRGLRPPFPCSAPQRRCGTIIIQPIYERRPTCCSAVYFGVSTNTFVSVKWKSNGLSPHLTHENMLIPLHAFNLVWRNLNFRFFTWLKTKRTCEFLIKDHCGAFFVIATILFDDIFCQSALNCLVSGLFSAAVR